MIILIRVQCRKVLDRDDRIFCIFYRILPVYLQEKLDVLVVGDDTVVNDNELIGLAGGVRVRVDSGGYTVSCPPEIKVMLY